MSTDSLQRVFKTLADPTRLRILSLLEREELAVQELMDVLGMAQSRVSRHLGILREAEVVRDRREGTFVLYQLALPEAGPWRAAWDVAVRDLREDPIHQRDQVALAGVLEARTARTKSFFDAVGPEWDALRKVWSDDLLRARALARLVPDGTSAVDVGTGTGAFALELAQLGISVVAVDRSARMLAAARSRLEAAGATNVELRAGDASALPLRDAEVDAAFAHMVLQYLASPGDALREMARVVRPGGRVIVADFTSHEREWMREELGVLRLGFAREEVESLFTAAGLVDLSFETQPAASRGADLPATFIAKAKRPEGAR
jgi:SAM-dependent methyltransferase/DNA-binding transcriptional ArsR family regulator